MSLQINKLKRQIQDLNERLFNGLLKIDFPIKIDSDLVMDSSFCAKVEVSTENRKILHLTVKEMWLDHPVLEALLAHELIHVYQVQVLEMTVKDILAEDQVGGGHGPSFSKKAAQIERDFGIDTYNNLYKIVQAEFRRFLEDYRL